MPDKAPEKKKLVVEHACGTGWDGVYESWVAVKISRTEAYDSYEQLHACVLSSSPVPEKTPTYRPPNREWLTHKLRATSP